MDNKELISTLEFFEEKVKGLGFDLKFETSVFYEIIEQKEESFKKFQDEISLKWDEFKQKNEKRIIKRTFTTFFYNNFHAFLKLFLQTFFGFDGNKLNLKNKEKISDEFLLLEYSYYLTPEEDYSFQTISRRFKSEIFHGLSFSMGYLFFLIRFLGLIIRRTIQETFFILLDAIIGDVQEKQTSLNFMIIIKDSKDDIFHNYYNMALYYFLLPIEGISEEHYNNLLLGREKLYQIALEEYPLAKEKLVNLLYYFYKKCNLLQSFSPLLDFFNFVGARVEDSVFSKVDIIKKEFFVNLDEYSTEKKNTLIEFFDFLDKKSTLYSTFQANNLPSQKSQLNLFLLYMRYYFGSGLEALEVSDLLFLPPLFKETLDSHNKTGDDVIGATSIKNIRNFLTTLYSLSNVEHIDLFFKKIFKKNISNLNYGFFKTFLKSFNAHFESKINKANEHLLEDPENIPFTFEVIVDHICRILYIIIDKIFLRSNPNDASNNFIDPRSRYIGKNIALRVLELFVFQDINYSDDIWPDYVISLNKDQLIKNLKDEFDISIPETKFYTDEELTQIILTYNIQSFTDQPYFEEWLIYDILIPLNNLILNIKNSVEDPTNEIEIYEQLSKFFLSDIDIEYKDTINELKLVCKELAPFWSDLD